MNTAPEALLSLTHIDVMRGDREALHDINLEIARGEHVCILGPNGCGKSTLIKTITRECYPLAREGSRISILGRERWDIFELRSLLGIVSPDLLASCTTDATGRDVVLSGFFSSTRIFPHHHRDPKRLALADEAMARLGIAHLAARAVAEMSSGEAQRTLIARALVHQPQTLLFDEPGNALDIGAQLQLRDTMRELAWSFCAEEVFSRTEPSPLSSPRNISPICSEFPFAWASTTAITISIKRRKARRAKLSERSADCSATPF